ncbi:class I SAM-dependent methyltransferase [Actinomadura craniellae]|uniref:Class I SAM-dependent methyltransferase n=1 Tax=Actinomadura craniellae TaxID=2231787 RepID=A0A365H723_9ACTN|nr:class I SAM-dependent methyltransferase [Actinomadura craniellae]RAY14905.1 class I SAM-dependent methyltransferase [Actinomadura craniellae]
MAHDPDEHYRRLARTYERNWADRPGYVAWMAERIMAWLEPAPDPRIVDVGSGTGLFLNRLMSRVSATTPLLCVDPSQPMLDMLPDDPRLTPVCATAEQIATGEVPLPYEKVDAFVFKEAIHHVKGIPETLRGLAGMLAPGGLILIVTLPPRLDYPLFPEALDRFAAGQPEPADLVSALDAADLEAECAIESYTVTIDREQWLDLVGNQWMSVLSTFSTAEIEAGLDHIRARHPGPTITYEDRFAFVRGVRT